MLINGRVTVVILSIVLLVLSVSFVGLTLCGSVYLYRQTLDESKSIGTPGSDDINADNYQEYGESLIPPVSPHKSDEQQV